MHACLSVYVHYKNVSAAFVRICACASICTVRAPVLGRHQFFGTSEHYGKAHGSLLSGWMIYNYTACCWFPTSSNILILPSQFWQIRFESCWLHCSKCRILVLLRYLLMWVCTHCSRNGYTNASMKVLTLRWNSKNQKSVTCNCYSNSSEDQ